MPMDGALIYRGVNYSVTDYLGNGKWRWKLHPTLKPGSEVTPSISGELCETRDEAVAAAQKAIDTHPNRDPN